MPQLFKTFHKTPSLHTIQLNPRLTIIPGPRAKLMASNVNVCGGRGHALGLFAASAPFSPATQEQKQSGVPLLQNGLKPRQWRHLSLARDSISATNPQPTDCAVAVTWLPKFDPQISITSIQLS